MKATATRSTEIFIDCPNCKADITHIPDKDIDTINENNPETLHCPQCTTKIYVVSVL